MHHELQLCTEELLDLKKVVGSKPATQPEQETWNDPFKRFQTFNQLLDNKEQALDESEGVSEIKRTIVDSAIKVNKCEYCQAEFEKIGPKSDDP
jgi:hypothetical protein